MTLSNYDPRLLNFLYELTKLNRFMSYRNIAKEVEIDGKKVSPKTIERWFRFLKQPYSRSNGEQTNRFDYFPKFHYEKLGLTYVYVFLEDPCEELISFFDFSKYQNYAIWLYDFVLRKRILCVAYPLPLHHLSQFEKSWQDVKKSGKVKNYTIKKVFSSFMIYSPWHKVFDKNGIFHPQKNDSFELSSQIEEFRYYLKNLPEVRLNTKIQKNPLMLPVLFEHHFESWSSQRVWTEIKSTIGPGTWDYIRKKKKQTDGYGIKRIQEAIRDINMFGLVSQMKIVYLPAQLDNLFLYVFIDFDNREDIVSFLKQVSFNTVQLSVYPMEKNKIFLIAVTNHKGFSEVISLLEDVKVEQFYFVQHDKSLSLLQNKEIYRFNYASLFNPKKLEWK